MILFLEIDFYETYSLVAKFKEIFFLVHVLTVHKSILVLASFVSVIINFEPTELI